MMRAVAPLCRRPIGDIGGYNMSDELPEVPNKVFSRETAEALANSLRAYPHPVSEDEQLILDLMVHWLTDPIERLKLGPAVQFTQEEEDILQSFERSTRRLP